MTAGSDVSGNGSRAGYADLARLGPVRARIAARVVGREHELELILAAVSAGRDMLVEGPPGTSKSTLLRAITAEWGVPGVAGRLPGTSYTTWSPGPAPRLTTAPNPV